MAKETYYFSHDSNAITDTKILNMRADYGLEGYGLFWAIIEMMRNEESYKLQADKKIYRAIKTLTNTNIDVEKYVQDCINEYELFKEDNGYFFSNSLLKRMLEKDRKSAVAKEKAGSYSSYDKLTHVGLYGNGTATNSSGQSVTASDWQWAQEVTWNPGYTALMDTLKHLYNFNVTNKDYHYHIL